jgi:ABC-type branched-subunit amino acid transport system substrate-binding protein
MRLREAAWLATLMAAITGCGNSPHRPIVTLGGILSTTGSNANGGSEQLLAFSLAVDEINRRGGVLGHDLAIDNRDDTSDPEVAKQVAAELIRSVHPPMILGAVSSAVTLAVAEVTSAAQRVSLSHLRLRRAAGQAPGRARVRAGLSQRLGDSRAGRVWRRAGRGIQPLVYSARRHRFDR